MPPVDLLSNSFNFLCGGEGLCHLSWLPGELQSISIDFPCARRPSVNFRQLFVRQGDLLSNSVNFTFSRDTCHQPIAWRPTANFLSRRVTFHQFLPTLRTAGRPFVTFRQFLIRPGDLPSSSANVRSSLETFRQLASTFRDSK